MGLSYPELNQPRKQAYRLAFERQGRDLITYVAFFTPICSRFLSDTHKTQRQSLDSMSYRLP